ncbi:MAG TPA: M3 family metallopeptidase [Myxococcales bacterium]
MRISALFLVLVASCATLSGSHESRGPWSFASTQPVDVPPLRTRWTPEEVKAACDQSEKVADAKLLEVVAIPDAQRTFANTADAIEQITTDWGDVASRVSFMKDIHTDAKVRAAAAACEEQAGKYAVRLAARKDLYLATKNWLEGPGKSEDLTAEQRRLVELAMREFKRAGLGLPDAEREKLVQLRSRLAELQTRFATNLDEDTTSIELSKDELPGMPESYLARLKPGSAPGKVIVTTKYPDFFPLMENCRNEETRNKMERASMSRGSARGNVKLLDEAIALRDEAAHMLGYATHADFVTEVRMAKNGRAVAEFESKLQGRLKSRLAADTAKMEALKAADTGAAKAVINSWDWRYYLNQLRKRDYALDDEQIRAYFPADKVMAGMLDVYSRVLSVEFRRVPKAEVWADGVEQYEIHDVPGGRLLAKFYVDLFPREGKYGHAASFGLGPARGLPGGYEIPLSVLVVNFEPPQGGKVAHLSLNEVDTLFHEFGHIMHQCLTTARYASLSGSNVATDFVEAPSQMLENFVFEPEVLALISTGLPPDLMKRMAAARRFDAGVRYSRQIFLGSFDLFIHTHGAKVDSESVARQLWSEIMTFPEPPDAHFAAGFGHVMGGYDAGYYGYLWSEVFSADMFTRFQKQGVLNPKTGREYRDAILAQGRVKDPDELLKEFLGRAPTEDAFLKQIGIEAGGRAQR